MMLHIKLHDSIYTRWFQTIFFHVSHYKKASEYDQKIPQSHTVQTNRPM